MHASFDSDGLRRCTFVAVLGEQFFSGGQYGLSPAFGDFASLSFRRHVSVYPSRMDLLGANYTHLVRLERGLKPATTSLTCVEWIALRRKPRRLPQ